MFLRIGHRGAKAYATENTLESFQKAIKLGANAIELDIRQAGDGTLIICHNESLKKVFGKDIRIAETSLEELKQTSGGQIPTLEEALQFIGRNADRILIEIKEPGYEKKVLELVKKSGLEKRTLIISFHEAVLEQTRKLDRAIQTGLIYAKYRNPVGAALRLHADYLVPFYRFVHTRDIEQAHSNQLRVIVWTINTAEEAEAFIARGVDGIATDKPDIFKGITKRN